eukprot:8056483-Prorocentrum_lima.AAC.1
MALGPGRHQHRHPQPEEPLVLCRWMCTAGALHGETLMALQARLVSFAGSDRTEVLGEGVTAPLLVVRLNDAT